VGRCPGPAGNQPRAERSRRRCGACVRGIGTLTCKVAAVDCARLSDTDADVRVDAVSDLGLLSDPQAESLLAITAMQDPAPSVRLEALYALESLRAESQLATFRHALDDPDKDVRKAAMSALEELETTDIRTAR
jgi:hypothetical protein